MTHARWAALMGFMLATLCQTVAAASGMLELGVKKQSETILTIGTAPPKKKIELDLGSLRTRDAQLPPAPLTRTERMALRAKRAVARQRQVSNARRHRQESRPTAPEAYDESEGFPVDGNGEPVLE